MREEIEIKDSDEEEEEEDDVSLTNILLTSTTDNPTPGLAWSGGSHSASSSMGSGSSSSGGDGMFVSPTRRASTNTAAADDECLSAEHEGKSEGLEVTGLKHQSVSRYIVLNNSQW